MDPPLSKEAVEEMLRMARIRGLHGYLYDGERPNLAREIERIKSPARLHGGIHQTTQSQE
jgi:hypothetical protein